MKLFFLLGLFCFFIPNFAVASINSDQVEAYLSQIFEEDTTWITDSESEWKNAYDRAHASPDYKTKKDQFFNFITDDMSDTFYGSSAFGFGAIKFLKKIQGSKKKQMALFDLVVIMRKYFPTSTKSMADPCDLFFSRVLLNSKYLNVRLRALREFNKIAPMRIFSYNQRFFSDVLAAKDQEQNSEISDEIDAIIEKWLQAGFKTPELKVEITASHVWACIKAFFSP